MVRKTYSPPPATHSVVAVDGDGNVLWETGSAWSEEAAEKEKRTCNRLLEVENDEELAEVERYEVRER